MVLGLLLARGRVEVTVLEKHGDFLRDFRGDTVHPTTLDLLDELGLGDDFARLPARRLDHVELPVGGRMYTIAELDHLPGKHEHIAMVPQWDLLDLLMRAAQREHRSVLHRQGRAARARAGLRPKGLKPYATCDVSSASKASRTSSMVGSFCSAVGSGTASAARCSRSRRRWRLMVDVEQPSRSASCWQVSFG